MTPPPPARRRRPPAFDWRAAMRRVCGFMIVAALLASGVAAPAGAGRDAGEAALRRGDFAAALAEFRPLAEAGDAQSRFDLGVLHQHGWSTPRDTAAAIAWYERAARQGHVQPQHNLGVIYLYGQGVAQSDVQAFLWFSLAADAPLATAATNRDLIAARMSAAERAEADALVEAWREKWGK